MPEERRLVTVLFADVVGSTSLGESLDPEDLRALLARFYDIASEVVREHGGTLEKFIGDAAMAIFGLTQAHDDDARRALDAALDLRERLREDPHLGERLPIRIGLNTGEVVANRDPDRSDFLVTGDAVNVAARMQQAAEPWQILASGRTASADLGAHEFGTALQLELKGKRSPVAARVVLGRSDAISREHGRLVGREADLAQLELVARRTFTERRPYLVTLIAPAGTGKSRLVEEFLSRMEDLAAPPRVAVAQCLPYGQRLTYWPMRALLLGMIGLDEGASAEDTHRAIRAWLDGAGAEHPEVTSELLAATIGASEADISNRALLFNAWREALELAAAEQPLILLVEDLHWSSDSLLDLLEFVLQPRADSPTLVLTLARPELLERRSTWGGGRRNHISLALEPLDDTSISELVSTLLEGAAPELTAVVVRRAEGNPFYAGEIVRSLLESGTDLGDADAVAGATDRLPDTVQATVLARLDALPPAARSMLQLGAVLGRSFSADGVAALGWAEPEGTDGTTDLLVERELVRPAGRGLLTFRHIIIRDVAYGTLPRSERAVLHAAAGRWLEGKAAERQDELAELIAFHFREAAALASSLLGVDPDVRTSAMRWLRRAADVAATARALVEASGHLEAAIDLATPAERPVLYQRLGELLGSGDRAVQAYARAWQLGIEEGESASFILRNLGRQVMVLTRFFASVARTVEEEELVDLIDRGVALMASADEGARATFLVAAANLPFWIRQTGKRLPTDEEYGTARERAEAGLALAEAMDDAMLISAALDGMTATRQTDWKHALMLSRRRVAMLDRLPWDERMDALNMVAWASAVLGDLPEVIRASQTALDLVQPGQNAGFALAGASWVSYARALRGEWDEMASGIEALRQRWIDGDRPAAAFALQGFLSGVDWARNRGADELHDRWRSVADDIIARFADGHPVAAMAAVTGLDLDGLVAIAVAYERYPDRVHYVEHALALCADHAQPVPIDVIESIIDRSRRSGTRVLEAQALRLRGALTSSADDLVAALEHFEAMGAARYAWRARAELGLVRRDEQLVAAALRELAALGESELPSVRGASGPFVS